ncbi:MAG TPA: metallophosphoesterase [Gaiellaceae bacterium]|nr:metallophosphoesterase [Gaiellaceae bacterium]
MRKALAWSAAAAFALVLAAAALAGNGTPIDTGSANALTLAVYGDAPYGADNPDTAAFDATPAFVDAVNHDPKVSLVLHAGDIHSGHQSCSQAYDQSIFDLWTAFKDPLVYTPGDNEWTDCHKSGEGGGDPIANLGLVRSIFFAHPGYTLGDRPKRVVSQAEIGTGTDGNYVENVMWEQSKTLFVTLNIPGGSNDDADVWFGAASPTQAQIDERAQRDQATLDWIDAAFARAEADGAGSVLILEQADMWDLDGKAASHIANYKPFIDSIASHTLAFGKPVLLINGDSHAYRSDNPLVDSAPCVVETGAPDTSTEACSDDAYDNQAANGGAYDVPNFHRLVVHGGTTFPAQPLEYTRLTDDPKADAANGLWSFGPFSWERVQP